MNRLFKLQFLGPLSLFAATLCAELVSADRVANSAGLLPRTMKQQLLFLTVILLVACAFFLPQALRGGILFPLDILHNQLPFLSTVPEPLKDIKNPHLSKHVVSFKYRPLSFYLGVQLCLGAIVLVGALIVYCRLRPELAAAV